MSSLNIQDQEDVRSLTIDQGHREEFKRLDIFLAHFFSDLSRTTIKRLFDDGMITSENHPLSINKMPPIGTVIEIEIPPPVSTDLIAQNIPLDILYEDPYLLVVNKPAGLCVHPAPGHYQDTLVNAVLYHCPDLQGIGSEKRPGIVHRLDLGTSGVMVVAKEQKTHELLVQLFSKHDIQREYEAISWGTPRIYNGKLETLIGRNPQNRLKMSTHVKLGKKAITYYETLKTKANITHFKLKLETGRTHQIRVHLSQELQCPVLCDPLYADVGTQLKKLPPEMALALKDYPHQLLHARRLGFIHPITGKELDFNQPPPAIMQTIIETLHGPSDKA